MRWNLFVDELAHDLRHGLRQIVRTPGFTAIVVLTLALGVGANTAIFTVVHSVMLRPLPYQDPDRLVRLWESNPAKGWPRFAVSHPNYLDWRAQTRSFERIAAQAGAGFTLTSGGEAEILRASAVTADLLPVLDVRPALGRNFSADEDRQGGNTRVAILTHGLWQRRFEGNPAIVGTRISLDNQPYEVIGVLPEAFARAWGNPRLDLLVPLAPDPARSRADHRLLVIGRLKPGVLLGQAQTEMETLATRLGKQYPESNEGWSVALATFYEWLIPPETRESLLILLGAVGLVLFIACGNVANLMLARASSREREFSVRAALGAERSRIIRQVLVEAMILALVAACAGILLAFATTHLVIAAAPEALPRLDELSVDATVVAFGIGIALASALLFGVLPAIQSSSSTLSESLKEGTRSATSSRGRQRLRAALVIGEVALSVALRIGAGLLIRSFARVQRVDPGFDTTQLITMRISLPRPAYGTSARSRAFYEQLLGSVAALPGVTSVATTSGIPLGVGNTSGEVTIPGKVLPPGVQASADWRLVSPGYFRALGISLRGRDFNDADSAIDAQGAPVRRVTIISEDMARRYWPGEDPIGKTVILHSFGKTPQTIIGVAGDVRSFGLDAERRPMVYASALAFAGWNPMNLVVRGAADPASHVPAIRRVVRALDPNVPIYDVELFDDLLSASLGERRFNMYLLACFAGTALVLASIGLFGVLAYLVTQRRRDIGIRVALGASQRDVFRVIVGQGMALAVAGALLGVAAGYAGAELMRTLLFSVEPRDPVTFAAVPALLVAVAFLASYVPARRAARVDPLVALRAE